ncbi:hypothetical protein ANCCAN_28077 [Ancylostoma caninum]|uniref:Uncharacterized protein n=1 Tax=Ancylostoma caninum TaxID=29170 RepID=A0A368F281_ANCCA|nr:hypothetical protein ANCCAN_28077 [Ancylostoma caninum]
MNDEPHDMRGRQCGVGASFTSCAVVAAAVEDCGGVTSSSPVLLVHSSILQARITSGRGPQHLYRWYQ